MRAEHLKGWLEEAEKAEAVAVAVAVAEVEAVAAETTGETEEGTAPEIEMDT